MIEILVVWLMAVVFIVLIVGGLAIYRGFVLCKLWTWFMVPLFHLPELTIPFAIGISLAIGMFQHSPTANENKREFWATALFSPLLILLMGWIVKMFI